MAGKTKLYVTNRVIPISSTQYGPNGENYGTIDCTRTLTWTNRVTFGSNYSNWKERIALGLQATTTLSGFRRTFYFSPDGYANNCHTAPLKGGEVCFGPMVCRAGNGKISTGGNDTFNSTLQAQAINQARQNFTKSYRKAVTQWQSGQFLGELAETVKFLVSPLKSLERLTIDTGKGLRNLQKKIQHAKDRESRYMRAATDSYLAYRFGAMPMLNDIQTAYQAVQHTYKQATRHIKLVGTGVAESSSITRDYRPSNCHNSGGYSTFVDISDKTTFVCSIKGAFTPDGPGGTVSPWDAFGLTPDNWAPTLYECWPSSFILDYFVNAGQVIDSVSFLLVDVSWMSQTLRQTFERKVSAQRGGNYYPTQPWVTGYGGRVVDVSIKVERTKAANDYIPSLQFHLASLGQSLNLAALANGLEGLKNPKWVLHS